MLRLCATIGLVLTLLGCATTQRPPAAVPSVILLRNASGRDATMLKVHIPERGRGGLGLTAMLMPAFNGSTHRVYRASDAATLSGPARVTWQWHGEQPQTVELPLDSVLTQFRGLQGEGLLIELQPSGKPTVSRHLTPNP